MHLRLVRAGLGRLCCGADVRPRLRWQLHVCAADARLSGGDDPLRLCRRQRCGTLQRLLRRFVQQLGRQSEWSPFGSRLYRQRRRRFVLDLHGVTFIDSSGLRTLVTARQRAEEMSVAFSLAGRSQAVDRLLQVTGLDSVFESS